LWEEKGQPTGQALSDLREFIEFSGATRRIRIDDLPIARRGP
jgi:hypothetical protein